MELQLCNELDTEGEIAFYEQKHYWLSNFSSFQVFYKDRLWPTSEHAYQAMKLEDELFQEIVRHQTSAHAAMTLARTLPRRADWDDIKIGVMLEICRAKLEQHPYIQTSLMKTGNRVLVEASPIDSFWGWGPDRKGRNELGKVWMELREEKRNQVV